jgi:NitT/TauT family transport system substrate-binding protein
LLEAHAAARGIQHLVVTWITISGADLSVDALLAGTIDVAAGGIPGMLRAWDRTHGTPREVRGVAAMSREPLLLNTRNPAVHTLRDFTDADRIAVPSRMISAQAVLLEMAAAKEWGDSSFDRLDFLTFSLSPPESTAGLLQHRSDFDTAFTVPPYEFIQLADPAIHTVLSSSDVVGDATSSMAFTTRQFHDANPVIYRAMLEAMREATEFVNNHPEQTASYFAEDSRTTVTTDLTRRLLADPRFKYDLTPQGTEVWAAFMQKVGRIHRRPTSWKDLFWPEIYDLEGS